MSALARTTQAYRTYREGPVSALLEGRRFRPNCMYRLLFANDFWHVLGSRSYVSGLLADTRVVGLFGLRTRHDLISRKVDYNHLGRQNPPLGHVNMPCRSVGRS